MCKTLAQMTRARKVREAAAAKANPDLIEKARALGDAAQHAGRIAAPAADPDFAPLIGPASRAGCLVPCLDAWNAAWMGEHMKAVGLA